MTSTSLTVFIYIKHKAQTLGEERPHEAWQEDGMYLYVYKTGEASGESSIALY